MMDISLLTNSLTDVGETNLQNIAGWAQKNGIKKLDVGPAIPLDKGLFESVLSSGTSINAMIFCRNFLASDKKQAEEYQKYLVEIIKFAGDLRIDKVVCSTGVQDICYDSTGFHPERSLDVCVDLAKRFLDEAEKVNVRIAWENCPVMGNIAVSPDIWEILFDRIGSNRLGLCYDPSHLVWQFIDPYENIFRFKDRIFLVHAKDTHVDKKKLAIVGVQQYSRWWTHRLPGLGDLDWNRLIDSLYQIGYEGTITIEHEDPIWSGSEEKVKKGILLAKRCLDQYLVH